MYEHITHTVLLRGNFIVLFIVTVRLPDVLHVREERMNGRSARRAMI